MELGCSWVLGEGDCIDSSYTCRRERQYEDMGKVDFFHPLAIRAGQIGATQIERLLFATTGVSWVVPPVCIIFASMILAAIFQHSFNR